MVSHAGTALLRELAAGTGPAEAVTGALLDTYRGFPLHLPGQVLADLAVAIADGADAVTGIEVLRDREARAAARERAWSAGAAPDPAEELRNRLRRDDQPGVQLLSGSPSMSGSRPWWT